MKPPSRCGLESDVSTRSERRLLPNSDTKTLIIRFIAAWRNGKGKGGQAKSKERDYVYPYTDVMSA